MFRGVTVLNLDAKGRMAIPARYREVLVELCASQLVVTADTDTCLLLYPQNHWIEIERKLTKLPTFNKQARILQRIYIGHASEVEMDGQGRILLPQLLRNYASLEKHVALVGQGDRFELWDEEAWNQKRDYWLENLDLDGLELPAALGTLSI